MICNNIKFWERINIKFKNELIYIDIKIKCGIKDEGAK